mmetsp:Transcript_98582/g.254840  ORF Transcript_98582/g.254840 Transcript_98582/m.254840 type:complete len:258 (+) Transcript_98582:20-793(+)
MTRLSVAVALLCAGGAQGFVAPLAGSASRAPRVFRGAVSENPAAAQAFVEENVEVAQEEPSILKWVGAGVLAGLLAAVSAAPPAHATADFRVTFSPEKFTIKAAKHLEPCKDNKKYHKKIKDQIYKITNRQKKYPKDSIIYNRFEKKIAGVQRREEAYGDRFCGKKDGLPRVIASGEIVRGGVVVPALMFLYTAGWIGWAGRSYLIRTGDEMKELNIDVPLALTCMASGFSWPVAAWQDIVNGRMVVDDKNVHRSFW